MNPDCERRMPNQTSTTVDSISPAERQQAFSHHRRKIKDRLGRRILSAEWDALKRCEDLITTYSAPDTELDPSLRTRWAMVRPIIRSDFQRLFDVVIPALIRDRVSPDVLMTEHWEALLRSLQKLDRQIHPLSKDSCERCLWTVLSTTLRGIMLAGRVHAAPPNWGKLTALLRKPGGRMPGTTGLPTGLVREFDAVAKRLAVTKRSRAQKAYGDVIYDCCQRLGSLGHSLTTLADLLETKALTALVELWEQEELRPETCYRVLVILRWLATDYYNCAAARQRVTFWVARFSERCVPQNTMIDAPALLKWSDEHTFLNLLDGLTQLAETGSGKAQPRSRIRISSGACFSLLSLYSLVLASELPELRFGPDGEPFWGGEQLTDAQQRWISDDQVKNSLMWPRVTAALAGYRALFHKCHGRMPHSLADASKLEQNYAGIVPSRMKSALAIAGMGLRPKDLPAIVVTLLLRQKKPMSEVARCAGYSSLLSFEKRYLPVQRLITSLHSRDLT